MKISLTNSFFIAPSAESLGILSVRWDTETETERKTDATSPLSRWNWRWVDTSLAQNSHALFKTLKWLLTLKWRGVHTFQPKKFALFVVPLSNGATCDRTTEIKNDRMYGYKVIFPIEKKRKEIKVIPKTIGKRERDCAWGCLSRW